jgi:hypothetical protein
MDFTVARSLNGLYIILDIACLIIFTVCLLAFRRRMAVVVGLLAGLVYVLVDYGIFYRFLGRASCGAPIPFWFLLWLSMSLRLHQLRLDLASPGQDGHGVSGPSSPSCPGSP